VKRRLVERNEVQSYIQTNMKEDKDAQRLERSEIVLKKFGLLPRNFDLQTFLVALLKEQVAGYYDPNAGQLRCVEQSQRRSHRPNSQVDRLRIVVSRDLLFEQGHQKRLQVEIARSRPNFFSTISDRSSRCASLSSFCWSGYRTAPRCAPPAAASLVL